MFDDIPLPLSWPVYVSQAEASAYARWKGRRLPTEAEFHRAAYGTPDGDRAPVPVGRRSRPTRHAATSISRSWEPVPAGSRPAGASAWGVHDLVGNGWEWTSTIFGPFAGFAPMASYPEYSADFFDGQHYVMKGASPATAQRARPRAASATGSARTIRTCTPRSGPPNEHDLYELRRRNSPPRSVAISRSRRSSCSRSTCTTRSGRACSTRSAGCRGTASRARRAACFARHAADVVARAADARTARRSWSSAAAAARSWCSWPKRSRPPRGARACT